MYIILNELSTNLSLQDIAQEEAREKINQFVKLIHSISTFSNFEGVIATADIYSFAFSPYYGIQEWLKDPYVQGSYKQFFRTIYGKRCSYIAPNDFVNEFEVEMDNEKFISIGCLAACEMKEYIISLETHKIWENIKVNGTLKKISEDAEYEIIKDQVISNLSRNDHLNHVEKMLLDQSFSNITSGQDLWESREALFPNLIFCNSVKDQLYNDSEKFHIGQIIKKLKRMQEYFSEYNGAYNPNILGLDARTESESVKNTPELKEQRLFLKPDGTKAYFYNHVGFTGKYCGRIHFLPDDVNKLCFIGYIGKHLKTQKY